MANLNWPKLVLILSLVTIFAPLVIGTTNQRKLQDDNTSIKCGCSSCSPCITNPSPPPPPPPCPPPPAEVFPPPPPPPKKPPTPSKDCPPPPMTPYLPSIFIPGPPGNLYPIDNFDSGSRKKRAGGGDVVVVFGLVGVMMAFW